MTKVKIIRNNEQAIIAFEAKGHSDKMAIKGNDIYCAAISAITQTAAVGLAEYAKAETELKMEDGYLFCRLINLTDAQKPEVKAILETMRLGLYSFSQENGKYIRLIEEVF